MANAHLTRLPLASAEVKASSFPNNFFWRKATDLKCIQCDIIFGSPKDDCYGSGICKVVALNQTKSTTLQNSCKSAGALMTVSAKSDSIGLVFFRGFLCANVVRTQFSKGLFHLPCAVTIPTQLAEFLGLQGRQIQPGHYAVEVCASHLRIDLKIA